MSFLLQYFDVAQIIGYVGLSFSVVAFQCRKHRNIMIYKTLNELFFCVQYLLLGAYTGAAMNLIGSARNLLFANQVAKNRSTRGLQILFSVLFAVFGLLTWQGPLSLMIIGAKIMTSIAYGIRRTSLLRAITLPTSVCWLIYNISISSVGGIMCEVFTISSILVAALRMDIVPWLKNKIRAQKSMQMN